MLAKTDVVVVAVAVAVTCAVVAAAAVVLLETMRFVKVGGTVSGPADVLREEVLSLQRVVYGRLVPSAMRTSLREAISGGVRGGRSTTCLSLRSSSGGGVGDRSDLCALDLDGGSE